MDSEVFPVLMLNELVSQEHRDAPVPARVELEKASQKLGYL